MQFRGSLTPKMIKMCQRVHKKNLLRIFLFPLLANLVLRPMVAKKEIQSSIKILKSELKMKDNLIKFRVSKIVAMVNNDQFGQLFISDTHAERTETIIKSTHQSYKMFNL